MSLIKAVRGTRDLLPPETELWNRVEATARRVFARYNFGEIRTPVFEDTQLFSRGVGEETDIVTKEMYTWDDRDRFHPRLLQEAWLSLNRNEFFETATSAKVGTATVDMVARRRGVYDDDEVLVVELVQFRQDVDSFDIEAMSSLLRQPEGFPQGAHLIGRIVVPEKRNAPLNVAKLEATAKALGLEIEGAFRDIHFSPKTSDGRIPKPPIIVQQLSGDFFQSSQRLTLRPENTAGVVRAYIEHKLGETGLLQKLYYIGPQFRRERPQKGRYRQFWQIGAEVIGPPSAGSESPLRDAEVLEMLASFLGELNITGWTLVLNSVGSSTDRPRYIAALREALRDVAPKMCGDCQRRAETNPLRVLDCKVPEDQPIIETLPKIADYLDDASKAHFAAVRVALDACGVPYTINPRLVRGLDYYTRTTFEFTHGGLGAQNALLGGGRYDGLSEMLGGPKAPGIGFAMGLDRLVLTLQTQQDPLVRFIEHASTYADCYLAPLGENMNAEALELAKELRSHGLRVEVGDGTFRLKKSFEIAEKQAWKIVLLGEHELQSGRLRVKNFATREQRGIDRRVLLDFAKKEHQFYWRIPTVGDLVHKLSNPRGTWAVTEVREGKWNVDIQLISAPSYTESNIPWSDIGYNDELASDDAPTQENETSDGRVPRPPVRRIRNDRE
jgi:histidyl-tRNA synthetase